MGVFPLPRCSLLVFPQGVSLRLYSLLGGCYCYDPHHLTRYNPILRYRGLLGILGVCLSWSILACPIEPTRFLQVVHGYVTQAHSLTFIQLLPWLLEMAWIGRKGKEMCGFYQQKKESQDYRNSSQVFGISMCSSITLKIE